MKIGSKNNFNGGEKAGIVRYLLYLMYRKEYKYLILLIIILAFLQTPNKTIVHLFASQTILHWNIIYQAFTSLLLHYNVLHLSVNLTILISTIIIANMNHVRIKYLIPKMLVIGYFSNLIAIALSYGYNLPETLIMGLSGGILGIVGIVISEMLLNINKSNLLKTTISLSVIGLLLYALMSPNIISNILHISGLCFGIIAGIGSSFNITNKEKDPE